MGQERRFFACAILAALGLGCPQNDPPARDPSPGSVRADTGDCELRDRSAGEQPVKLPALNDPVAKLVLRGVGAQGCPRTQQEVHDKLAKVDAEGCENDGMFSEVQSFLLSERAQLRRTAQGKTEGCVPDPIAGFRAITARLCGDRPPYALLMATFGLTLKSQSLPPNAEMIGWDPDRGVFNYYTLEKGEWSYFGNSIDMMDGPTEDGDRRCAVCHPGGALQLKELRSPWVFWEGRDTLPGVGEILAAHPALGSRAQGKVLDLRPAGKELEEIVEAGNLAWTKTRVAVGRQKGSLRRLLRPLYCTMEFELRAASQKVTPPSGKDEQSGSMGVSAGEFLVDPAFGLQERVVIDVGIYNKVIADAGQRVETGCGARLVDAEGAELRDAAFDLVYPHRSAADEMAVEELIASGVIDREFAQAVLAVDFTRPVFSEKRCNLLEYVPELPPKSRSAAVIRKSVLNELRAHPDDETAAKLASSLGALNTTVLAPVRAFVSACAKRKGYDITADLVAEVSWRRRQATKYPILELREMLPVDDLPEDDAKLDPVTCRRVP